MEDLLQNFGKVAIPETTRNFSAKPLLSSAEEHSPLEVRLMTLRCLDTDLKSQVAANGYYKWPRQSTIKHCSKFQITKQQTLTLSWKAGSVYFLNIGVKGLNSIVWFLSNMCCTAWLPNSTLLFRWRARVTSTLLTHPAVLTLKEWKFNSCGAQESTFRLLHTQKIILKIKTERLSCTNTDKNLDQNSLANRNMKVITLHSQIHPIHTCLPIHAMNIQSTTKIDNR